MRASKINSFGVFTGEVRDVEATDGLPDGWVRTDPPVVPAGKHAKWLGSSWQIRNGEFATATVQPAPVGPVVPSSVTRFQGRTLLRSIPAQGGRSLFHVIESDLKQAVQQVQNLPETNLDRIRAETTWDAWENTNHFYRDSQLINTLAAMYNISEQQMDQMFIQAEGINV